MCKLSLKTLFTDDTQFIFLDHVFFQPTENVMKEHGLTVRWGVTIWVLDLTANEYPLWGCQLWGSTEEVSHKSQIL